MRLNSAQKRKDIRIKRLRDAGAPVHHKSSLGIRDCDGENEFHVPEFLFSPVWSNVTCDKCLIVRDCDGDVDLLEKLFKREEIK